MICHPNNCTACGTCMNVCTQNAITMQIGIDGYYEPAIDESSCVHCGLCEYTCPQLNPPLRVHFPEPACYAFQADDETRSHSSSGGMFSLIARKILELGGVVFGSAYDENLVPRHIEINSLEQLPLLQKSKYTQSDTGYTFRRVRELLRRGIPVLYVGVPCQIGGLYAYLKEDDPNLYTADVMCSGTSAVGIYRRYLQELEQSVGKKLTGIDFRNKDNGWSAGHSTLYFSDGTMENRSFDPFMRVFISAGMKAHACNECNYAEFPRYGDLTLGDFWNIEKYNTSFTDGYGTSLITVNSTKGETLMQEVRDSFPIKLCEPVDFFFTRGSNWFTRERPIKEEASRFYDLVKKHSIHDSLEYILEKRYDICCVGNWSGYNYGAQLTHYALFRTLTDLGYEVLMVEKPNEPPFPPLPTVDLFRNCPYPTYALSPLYNTLHEMRELNGRCNIFITGSDMLWNYDRFGHSMDFYSLSFVTEGNKKISYATSFGYPVGFTPEEHSYLFSLLLSRYDYLSTREDFGVEIAKEKYNIKMEQVLDPVFLCDPGHYMKMARQCEKIPKGKYILCYIINSSNKDEKIHLIEKIAREKKLNVMFIADALASHHYSSYQNKQNIDIENVGNASVEDWLAFIINSEMVITDSFHAFAFSVIFEKQVFPLYDLKRDALRVISVVKLLNLPYPIILTELDDHQSLTEIDRLLECTYIDYQNLKPLLEEEIAKSRKWLVNAITSEKKDRIFDTGKSLQELLVYYHSALKYNQTQGRIQRVAIQREHNSLNEKIISLQQELKEGKIEADTVRSEQIKKTLELRLIISELKQEITNLNDQIISMKLEEERREKNKLLNKIRGGMRCYREHGLRYTVNRIAYHAKHKA